MLYATNGTVQELPSNTQFQYWDSQIDFGRAFKVAKIEQQDVVGVRQAPLHEFLVHILLSSVANDPRMVWTSRPRGQAINWVQWGKFCRWFFSKPAIESDRILKDVSGGYVSSYLPQFLAANIISPYAKCYETSSKIDASVFWDYFKFNFSCESTRSDQLPEHWPTPEEMAKYEDIVSKWGDLWGQDNVRQFVSDPPSMSTYAAEVSSKATPAPLDTEPDEATSDSSSSWVVPALAVGAIGVVVFLSTRK